MTTSTAADAHAAFRDYPAAELDDLLANGPILVLAPHPDDETLGCGGLIARAAAAGIPCSVAILTDGAASHQGSPSWSAARLAETREQEAREALRILGHPADRLVFHRFPDTRLPGSGPEFERAVAAVRAQARRDACRTLAAPWEADPHCDHAAAARIAAAAAAATTTTADRDRFARLHYPVWGWTLPAECPVPPVPQGSRLDIEPVLHRKRAAIAAHRSQHAGLIDDAARAFSLPPDLLAACLGRWETYIGPAP